MRTHLSLPTRRLDDSVAFYRHLLEADPAKHFDDYALFVTDQPALELALGRWDGTLPDRPDAASHFGIAVDSPQAVDRAMQRLQAAGVPIDVERGEVCCYAKQDKVWATDPDGRRWEVYHVLEETQERDGAGSACCQS